MFSLPDLRILTTNRCPHYKIFELSLPTDVLITRSSNYHYRSMLSLPDLRILTGDPCLPPWGLSSREPQIPKSLRLCVCDRLLWDLPNGICTGPKRRYHSVFWQSVRKRVQKVWALTHLWSWFPGPEIFITFLISWTKISACSGELQSIIETHLLFANLTDREVRKSPSKGATCPAGPN